MFVCCSVTLCYLYMIINSIDSEQISNSYKSWTSACNDVLNDNIARTLI